MSEINQSGSRFKLTRLEERIVPSTMWCSCGGSHRGGSSKKGGSRKGGSHKGGSRKGGSRKGGSRKGRC